MIRIITARDETGQPTEWRDYREVLLSEVTHLDAIEFDDTDPALLKHLGVETFAEASYVLAAMGVELTERTDAVATALGALPEGDERDAEQARLEGDMARWMATDPRFRLSAVVAIWAAMRAGGDLVTIRDVLAQQPRDQLLIENEGASL